MTTMIIQKELEKSFRIQDNGSYDVKTPYYNYLLASTPKEDVTILFPIEQITRRSKPLFKLPFKLGKLVYETGKEIMRR